MSLAGLGSFAGGVAAGIGQGARVNELKQLAESRALDTGLRKKAAERGDIFANVMKGLLSGDEATMDALRNHFGMPSQTVTPGGTSGIPQQQVGGAPGVVYPQAGAGLGSI